MKPKLIHQEAMDYSFQAKQALAMDNHASAFELYKKAAELESKLAEFYFDKPELEPTRSIIIRSAAFLNLKAGSVEMAKKFIFFGLLNTSDAIIKEQLNNALELAMSMNNVAAQNVNAEINYINLLRQRSLHYIMEPSNPVFGHSVSFEMLKNFTDNYLKSVKAYAVSKFKKVLKVGSNIDGLLEEGLEKLINPLITNTGYGSLKFSVANDFLLREGEQKELLSFKSNVIIDYHNEIFANPLSDSDINQIKENYSEEEINDIFRPLSKIKSPNSSYKIGYYDSDNFNKIYTTKIINKQKTKLLTVKKITQEEIGELESSIVHKRSSSTGKVSKKTIFKEQLRSFESAIKTNQIIPKERATLILSEEILIIMNFNSDKGFTFSFDDFRIESTDVEYDKALTEFYNIFYNKLVRLVNKIELTDEEQKDFGAVSMLIGNTDTLKNV